jgi:hypothetical protein
MNITIRDGYGLPVGCETEGCRNPASTVWSSGVIAGGRSAGQHYACHEHNPMTFTTATLPFNFHSQPLCHACGQPVNVGNLIKSF